MRRLGLLSLLLLIAAPCRAEESQSGAPDQEAINEAVRWIQAAPIIRSECNYIMLAKVRLLLFWVGRDDVGGGYIKLGSAEDDPQLQVIQLLFGSDPAKAPRGINRWGAGTEVLKRAEGGSPTAESSAFLGFMKSSKGDSTTAMQRELSSEHQAGKHLFEAIISRVDRDRAISTTVPFYSDQDYDLRQLPQAEKAAMDRLGNGEGRKFHRLTGAGEVGCERASGFLSTVSELVWSSLDGKKPPYSLCYVYNAHRYTATLQSVSAVPERAVHITLRDRSKVINQTYHNLQEMRFRSHRHDNGNNEDFSLLVGTSGTLRGIPIQIRYQPNWWFQVILNLLPSAEPVGQPAGSQ
jgi:hypothetical protein